MRWSRALFLGRLVLLVLAALLLLSLSAAAQPLPAAPPDPAPPVLFSALPGPAPLAPADEPNLIRSGSLAGNLDLLAPGFSPAPRRVRVELFPDAVYTAALNRLETHDDGAYSWAGTIEGAPFGEIHITVLGDSLNGTIVTLDRQFGLASAGDGSYIVRQVNAAALPPEAEPLVPENLPAADAAAPAGTTSDPCTDVNLMVVYTPAAAAWASSHGGIDAFIDNRVTNTNTGYGNSQVTQRVHLVYKGQVSYTQPADPWSVDTWSQVLSYVTNPADGVMDQVHTLRDAYKADETLLFVRAAGSSACGIGWLMQTLSPSFAGSAFAVVDVNCADYQFSHSHELGHNMGSHHEHYSAGSDPTIYPYSYGYVHSSGASTDFRTMMAYADSCTQMPNGYYCPRVNYWSNPNQNYNGFVMGVPGTGSTAADNHLSLNNTCSTVANFRSGEPFVVAHKVYLPIIKRTAPPDTPVLNAINNPAQNPAYQVTWSAAARASGYVLQEDTVSGFSHPTTVYTGASTVWNTWGKAAGTYYYRVKATNEAGESAWSAPQSTTVMGPKPPAPVLNAINNPSHASSYQVTWSAATGATSYTLQEDTDGSFPHPTTAYNGTWTLWDAWGKAAGTYYYRVKASNGAGDSPWSGTQSTTVTGTSGPNAGFWQNQDGSSEFIVNADRASVSNYAIYISLTGCGDWRIYRTVSDPIVNNQMSFTGAFYATVNFSSVTAASGSDGLNHFYLAPCNGYVTGGPWPNNFTWQHAAAAPGFIDVTLTPRPAGDPAPQDVPGVTVERVP